MFARAASLLLKPRAIAAGAALAMGAAAVSLEHEVLSRPTKDGKQETFVHLNLSKHKLDHHFLSNIRGEEKLEHYELYIKKDRQALSAKARFGHRATGHPTIVHGGAIAALLDDSFGCLFLSQGASGFTASLNLQYKKPLPAARDFIVDASIDRVEQSKSGKSKVFMKGIVRDAENESIIYTEAEALFIATTAGLADGQTRISKKVAEIVAHVQPEAAASSGVAGAGAGAAAAAGATEGVAEAVEAQQ